MNNELKHHGVLGQRWGIRRYQNKDGSLTPAGRKRLGKEYEEYKKESTPMFGRRKSSPQSESIRDLSDAELKQRIQRIQMEKQYAQLTAKQKSVGRKAVEEVLLNSGKEIAKDYIVKYSKKGIDAMLKKMSDKD